MPYNTRRKSLSLPSLGIHLPNSSRVHRPTFKTLTNADSDVLPPTKKLKRSHDGDEPLSPVSSPRSKVGSPALEEVPSSTLAMTRGAAEQTPPPSPKTMPQFRKVDIEGINDDIVIGVIEQLEKTGNRPHLIRDLAAILALSNDSIAQYDHPAKHLLSCANRLNSSANPAALLSSRLSLYLKRPWTALSPCPLAKELIPVHPRKVFFFLTTQPRLPLPQSSDDILPPSLISAKNLTPSISDHSLGDDSDLEQRHRARLSPSPEVELYSPELDQEDPMQPPTPGQHFSARSSLNPDGTPDIRSRPNRAPSPPLEADERGFTETATAVRARGMSLRSPTVQESVEIDEKLRSVELVEETPEVSQKRDRELGLELFGHTNSHIHVPEQKVLGSSPMIHAKPDLSSHLSKPNLSLQLEELDIIESSWALKSPEQMDIDELDDLFTGF
ncbi:hypothetical protein PV10_01355 [Exophiala mesophila]|uniref:GDS1 winged helix domain-containing protein n=1 Tax=Exophiala mesophila TaxID=212818 RepID=A0A0D1ZST9_EXOME|nr:uncharacterized protein PV10_01355 [Exophiala mesophila]KIV97632.1 hypothetical protein PV10_01355 [Exophiala mesophila]